MIALKATPGFATVSKRSIVSNTTVAYFIDQTPGDLTIHWANTIIL